MKKLIKKILKKDEKFYRITVSKLFAVCKY